MAPGVIKLNSQAIWEWRPEYILQIDQNLTEHNLKVVTQTFEGTNPNEK